ncbi:MAG: murein biosynthesis integral membrane protein MurJ [Parvibaculales bacterium]
MAGRFSIVRAAVTTGSATMLSRLLGFVRDILIAAALGAGPLADIFVVAFRLPNLFRRLFAEGAFSAAFVPLFAKRLEGAGLDSARTMAGEVFSVLAFALLVFTAVAELFMPVLVYALAGGFEVGSEKFSQTVHYARITFPYLAFMSLMALFAAMLNATGRFALAGLAPVLLNLVLIGALVLAWGDDRLSLDYLIWGVAVAGFLQLAVLWVGAWRAGLSLAFRRPRLSPDVRRVFVLGVPGVLAAGVTQINLLVGTNIASAQPGAAAWLYYADRLYQLPLGVIGVALSVALLPDISRRLRAGDQKGAVASQNNGLAYGLLLTAPASLGLYALAEPIMSVLFERGSFSASDTHAAALALMGFAPGLPAFVLVKVLQPSFFSQEDTKTPLLYAALGVGVNITLSLLYFPVYGHVAIAVATSIAGWVSLLAMVVHLSVTGWRMDSLFALRVLVIVLGCAAMWGYLALLTPPSGGFAALAAWLALQILCAASLYFAVLAGLSHFILPDGAAGWRGLARRS